MLSDRLPKVTPNSNDIQIRPYLLRDCEWLRARKQDWRAVKILLLFAGGALLFAGEALLLLAFSHCQPQEPMPPQPAPVVYYGAKKPSPATVKRLVDAYAPKPSPVVGR